MLFTKEWFSIDESVEILNKLTKSKVNLTRKYIKDLFLEEKLDLYIKLKLIHSYGVEIYSNSKKYDVSFSLTDENNVVPNECRIIDERLNADLTVSENGEFFGQGNFSIVSDNCSIIEQGEEFSILVSSFDIYAPANQAFSYNENNKLASSDEDFYLELYTETPIGINFKDIVIYIEDLLDTAKLIDKITKQAIKHLSNTDKQTEKIGEVAHLQAQITELENQLQAQQSAVNSQEVLPVSNLDENYNPTERDTHLLIIGALANLLAKPNQNKSRYLKGTGTINQSAINTDIETEIAKLLKPSTKERSAETIKQRIREALKLVKQAD